jgi:hypothetical protein
MLHPETELRLISAAVGHGIVAARPIPRGTLVWVQDELDQVVAASAIDALPPAGRAAALKYSARQDDASFILFWDHARFTNHSCAPVTLTAGRRFSIAIEDIPAGGEITEDYALLNLAPEESFTCLCGASRCRGWIGPGDVAAMTGRWRGAVGRALARVHCVPQPLAALLRDRDIAEARVRWAAG